jgi:hypothetical protein
MAFLMVRERFYCWIFYMSVRASSSYCAQVETYEEGVQGGMLISLMNIAGSSELLELFFVTTSTKRI